MKKYLIFVLLCNIFFLTQAQIYSNHSRMLRKQDAYYTFVVKELNIPPIDGHEVLNGDFHTHTYFSDGTVAPYVRVEEGLREGMDVIALTDHLEVYLFPETIKRPSLEIPYQEAVNNKILKWHYPGLQIIRGVELTKAEAHFNAVFVDNLDSLFDKDIYKSLAKAKAKNGFIIYNHPEWLFNEKPVDDSVFRSGLVQGIEVCNGGYYFPESFARALKYNLTMFGNSDVHVPIEEDFNIQSGEHRTQTLILSRSRKKEDIVAALRDHKTIVYSTNQLYGRPDLLSKLVENCIKVSYNIDFKGMVTNFVEFQNLSGIDFEVSIPHHKDFRLPEKFIIQRNSRNILRLSPNKDLPASGSAAFTFTFDNVHISPDTTLTHQYTIQWP